MNIVADVEIIKSDYGFGNVSRLAIPKHLTNENLELILAYIYRNDITSIDISECVNYLSDCNCIICGDNALSDRFDITLIDDHHQYDITICQDCYEALK